MKTCQPIYIPKIFSLLQITYDITADDETQVQHIALLIDTLENLSILDPNTKHCYTLDKIVKTTQPINDKTWRIGIHLHVAEISPTDFDELEKDDTNSSQCNDSGGGSVIISALELQVQFLLCVCLFSKISLVQIWLKGESCWPWTMLTFCSINNDIHLFPKHSHPPYTACWQSSWPSTYQDSPLNKSTAHPSLT